MEGSASNAAAGSGQASQGGNQAGGQANNNNASQASEGQAVNPTINAPDGSEQANNNSQPPVEGGEKITDKQLKKLAEQREVWFPDVEFESDDHYHDRIIDHVNELTDYKNKNIATNQKVMEVLRSNPELGDVIRDVSKGMSFPEALARHIDLSNIQPVEGDPDYEAFEKARQERVAKLKENDEFDQLVTTNQEASRKVIQAFFDNKKMDEAQVKEFVDFIDKIHGEMNKGLITEETLNHFYNAKNFTTKVDQAKELASIAAKNDKIDLKKEEDEKKGDGLPKVGQGNKIKDTPKPEKGPLDDMFESYQKKQEIYN